MPGPTRAPGRAAGALPLRPPARPRPLPSRSLHLSLTIGILALLVLYARRPGPYSASKPPPPTYAICTTAARAVYTVPPDADGLGAEECVVVDGKFVRDVGPLARVRRTYADAETQTQTRSPSSSSSSRPLSFGPVSLSLDLDALPGPLAALARALTPARKLKIIHLPPGYTVTPGLIDAHAHPLAYGHSRGLPLAGARSVAEVVSRVEAYAAVNPDGWVEGMGWDQNLWDRKAFPTAADLDTPALRGRPVALKRVDVHAEWVSPAVLALLGPLPETVAGGHIERDPAGRPTGIFIDNAVDLLDAVRPPWTDGQRAAYLAKTVGDALEKGMTAVHDAGVRPKDLDWFIAQAEKGKLGMRFYTMILCEDRETYCGDTEKVYGAGDDRLTVRAVKLFGDGALGSRGAALLDDYADQPGWRGFMLAPDDSWAAVVKRYYDDGWQVNVHCIGDRANRIVLNAMAGAIGADADAGAGRARRLRIEHAQIMAPDDLARAARMGVIASYQPTHATSDMWYAEDRLGSGRMRGAYAWQTYLSHGGRLALGSDFPVEPLDPLAGIHAAVARVDAAGRSPHGPGGWYPAEKLTRAQAIRGFTADAAYAAFSNATGSLAPGMRADFVVWDDDLTTVDARDLRAVRVTATVLDGRVVFGALGP
ncbi:hypothetical protein Q5752_002677 [Cryptotrichosporon argae]